VITPGAPAGPVEEFVFGYGSLAADGAGRPARLERHRRVWGVAMDNRVAIPGYKSYLLREDGSRPAVFVAFLDVVAQAGASTGGVLLAVDEVALRALDVRERNYERVDVTADVADAPGRVWTYRGSAAGRARLRVGVRSGSAVVARGYLEAVRAGFAWFGIEDDADPGALPVVDLQRVDLPPAP
jgi:Gamma-glutamyl cyclotransferase, AIG2-like